MSQLKLTADGGGGTVSLKGPSSTTGNGAIELIVPGTGSSTLATTATAGKILQVVHIFKGDRFTSNSNSMTDVTNLSVTITPTAANSKIIIAASLYFSHNAHVIFTKIMKDGTTKVTGSDSPEDQSFYAGTAYMLRATIIVTETAGNTNSRYYTPFWSTDTATAYLNQYINATAIYDGTSSMTVIEVAA